MFDIKIINGMVIDGIGDTRYRADIGITGDQITAIGNLADAPALETDVYKRQPTGSSPAPVC